MSVYGVTLYGTEVYGYFIPPVYRVDPFVAVPTSYSQINVSWNQPSGTIAGFRLIKNMFGAPVDQDDGEILLDITTGYPGNNFVDLNIVPGAYHYYGFYVLANAMTNEWVRAGVTGCLMVNNYNSSLFMQYLIPNFYANSINATNELVLDPVGNTFLSKFMNVIGWGMDYLRTQYDTYQNVNNPWTIPLNNLYTMAGQFNININPDIHPYTLRKAIFFNAIVNKLRGTTNGIATELSALTGWNADITVGQNLMLNNDQSFLADPFFQPWSGNITYIIGENVQFGNYFYNCIANGNYGNAPTGTSSSNTWWAPILSTTTVNTYLLNSATGWPSTWEILYPDLSNGAPAANSLVESIGTVDPLNTASFTFNSLLGKNLHGSTTDIWLRSVARTTADIATVTTTFAPDKYQAMADGIPIPFIGFNQVWSAATQYDPQDIVTYNNIPFVALRSSLNSLPPYASPGTANQDWAPLSFDQRFRFCISAYETASTNVAVYPFVEWYDAGGNYITRLIGRGPTPGSPEIPNQLAYDSFTVGAGSTLGSRTTNDGGNTWTAQLGSFSVSPFGTGCTYPTTTGQRSIATVNTGNANAQVGLTFVTAPNAGQSTGLVIRYLDNFNYLRADMTTLKQCSSGVFTTLGTYSTPCVVGDRVLVTCNGTTITVFRNNVQVLQVTSSFNQSSTVFGIINENT